MPLIDPLPESLEGQIDLASRETDTSIEAAIYSDLDQNGQFSEEWLVVTPRAIEVLTSTDTGYVQREKYELNKIKEVRADNLVGGGSLLARVNGHNVEVMRYSNALQRKFIRVADHINELKKYTEHLQETLQPDSDSSGEPLAKPVLMPDEEDQKHCANCGLILARWYQCMSCLHE